MPSSTHRPAPSHRSLGRDYEARAATFYQSQGFTILERNWQAGHKEIDLIVRRDDLLVFVEVKAARTKSFGHPAEWVSKAKQHKLILAGQQYLAQFQVTGCDIRFDVVCFVGGAMEHFPSAFDAEDFPTLP